jgi:hypothetical protein
MVASVLLIQEPRSMVASVLLVKVLSVIEERKILYETEKTHCRNIQYIYMYEEHSCSIIIYSIYMKNIPVVF